MSGDGTVFDAYFGGIKRALELVQGDAATLRQAATILADAIESGKMIYTFGTGHSSLLAAEGFFRAGGLGPVSAILEPVNTFAPGALASTRYERMPGIAETVLDRYPVSEGDVLVIYSNSGVNALPLELAALAGARGATVIAIVSREYAADAARRKEVKRSLLDIADIVLDNHLPPGDAFIEYGDGAACAPGSTVIGAAIWNALVAGTVDALVSRNVEPPIFLSANMDGAEENNAALIRKFRHEIRNL